MNPAPSAAPSSFPSLISLPPGSRFPPHLTMDQYVDFVEESLRTANADQVARQKALEERIRKPFCMAADMSLGEYEV
jgi:hypothetical protein